MREDRKMRRSGEEGWRGGMEEGRGGDEGEEKGRRGREKRRVMVRTRVRVVIKPISLSRYPLALKGILFGGPAMEKSLDTRRR